MLIPRPRTVAMQQPRRGRHPQVIAKTRGALGDDEAFLVHLVHCALDFLDSNPLLPPDKAPDIFRNMVRAARASVHALLPVRRDALTCWRAHSPAGPWRAC